MPLWLPEVELLLHVLPEGLRIALQCGKFGGLRRRIDKVLHLAGDQDVQDDPDAPDVRFRRDGHIRILQEELRREKAAINTANFLHVEAACQIE